jgi:hypothetical protein
MFCSVTFLHGICNMPAQKGVSLFAMELISWVSPNTQTFRFTAKQVE